MSEADRDEVVADLRLKPLEPRESSASGVTASMADETRWRWIGASSAALVTRTVGLAGPASSEA